MSSLALIGSAVCALAQSIAPATLGTEVTEQVEDLVSVGATEDLSVVMPTEPIGSVMGFNRSLVELPRSVSVLSSSLVDQIGIRDGDQLSRIIPGTYTVNRWGIAGSTNVRGNTADTYLRGIKRIDPQGNIKNVITMWDSVEVVRGPPSPIFGNGRIGGYVNYVPKSVRGTTGKYLDRAQGSITAIVGSYDRVEFQINYSEPLKVRGRDAGFQVFIQASDADSYYDLNFQRDRVFQGSFSMNLNDTWHFESGLIYQKAENAGQAGANRVTQATFDNGTYLRGSALVNLDYDRNGRVSEAEIQLSRRFPNGTVYGGNRPLSITFPATGGPAPVVPGVPQAFKDLLMLPEYAAAAASPAGRAILAAPVGGPRTGDGREIPIGFFLDPSTIGTSEREWNRVAIEEIAKGHTVTFYADVIQDADPAATQKLQFMFDYQKQSKSSQLPFNQRQEITVLETKYTVTRKNDQIPLVKAMPDWLSVDLLASANVRYTDGGGFSTSGDYDHRRDLVTGYLPTDTFASFLAHNDFSFATGEPVSGNRYSEFIETGLGTLFDVSLWNRLGVIGGLRYDYVDANTVEGERYNRTGPASQSAIGATLPRREADGDDSAVSKSLSVNYRTPWLGLTPYYTWSKASAVLSGSRQDIDYANVFSGNILGAATLKELGIKGSAVEGRLFYAVAAYDQVRSSSVEEEGESFIRATRNRGIEAELRYVPNRQWTFVLTGNWSEIKRVQLQPGTFRNANVTAAYLGFQDILDGAGNVVFPADAFLWGGNASVQIAAEDERYHKFGQYPDQIFGFFVRYSPGQRWGVTWNSNYVASVSASADLLDLLVLPSSFSHNASIYWDYEKWRISLNVRNVTDEQYFTPNAGAAGGTLLQPAFPRNFELAFTKRF